MHLISNSLALYHTYCRKDCGFCFQSNLHSPNSDVCDERSHTHMNQNNLPNKWTKLQGLKLHVHTVCHFSKNNPIMVSSKRICAFFFRIRKVRGAWLVKQTVAGEASHVGKPGLFPLTGDCSFNQAKLSAYAPLSHLLACYFCLVETPRDHANL